MKVFLSWSVEVSRRMARVLRDWLPSVLQFAEPYVSSEDIDKGVRWGTDIAKELESSEFGVIEALRCGCLAESQPVRTQPQSSCRSACTSLRIPRSGQPRAATQFARLSAAQPIGLDNGHMDSRPG